PPHLRDFPSSLAASTALWIASRDSLSVLGIRQDTLYLASPPLMLFASKMLAKEMRQGILTLVALELFLLVVAIEKSSVFFRLGHCVSLAALGLCLIPAQSRTSNSSAAV